MLAGNHKGRLYEICQKYRFAPNIVFKPDASATLNLIILDHTPSDPATLSFSSPKMPRAPKKAQEQRVCEIAMKDQTLIDVIDRRKFFDEERSLKKAKRQKLVADANSDGIIKTGPLLPPFKPIVRKVHPKTTPAAPKEENKEKSEDNGAQPVTDEAAEQAAATAEQATAEGEAESEEVKREKPKPEAIPVATEPYGGPQAVEELNSLCQAAGANMRVNYEDTRDIVENNRTGFLCNIQLTCTDRTVSFEPVSSKIYYASKNLRIVLVRSPLYLTKLSNHSLRYWGSEKDL